MSDETQLPDWLSKVRNAIAKIKPKIVTMRLEGQEEAKRGIEKTKEADRLDRDVTYLDRVFGANLPVAAWNDEIVAVSGTWLANRILDAESRIAEASTIAVQGGQFAQQQHGLFLRAVSDSEGSSGSAVFLGASIENRIRAIDHEYQPFVYSHRPGRIADREALLRELRARLCRYGQRFVSMLDGSEEALWRDDPDSLSQAAHSMRDCFQQLIQVLAPTDAVKALGWFRPIDGAPDGVSRRQRLRFILYGGADEPLSATMTSLDGLADIAKNALDLCMARAHGHDPDLTPEEVRLAVDHARHALNQLLEAAETNARRFSLNHTGT